MTGVGPRAWMVSAAAIALAIPVSAFGAVTVGEVRASDQAATAGKAGKAGRVYAPQRCERPRVRPTQIILTCADAGIFVNDLDWARWGGRRATGSGVLNVKRCDPDCAGGGVDRYPVGVELYKIRKSDCGTKRKRMYRNIALDYSTYSPSVDVPRRMFCAVP